MTPAIELLNQLGHPYDLRTFDHPANERNYAQAAAAALNIPADQIFKTLLWRLNIGVQIVAIAANMAVCQGRPAENAYFAGTRSARLVRIIKYSADGVDCEEVPPALELIASESFAEKICNMEKRSHASGKQGRSTKGYCCTDGRA